MLEAAVKLNKNSELNVLHHRPGLVSLLSEETRVNVSFIMQS